MTCSKTEIQIKYDNLVNEYLEALKNDCEYLAVELEYELDLLKPVLEKE